MVPASQTFQKIMMLVCSAVDNRRAAIEYGGATGETLAGIAIMRRDAYEELLLGMVGAIPQQRR